MAKSKRITIAKKAFKNKNIEATKKAHSKKAISADLHHDHDEHSGSGKYLGDAVYGAIDGIVTTFAIVSGVIGAELSANIILILGFANLIADGFSMAAGNYLSVKSDIEYQQLEYNREKWEIEHHPEGECEEIRQIYRAKGFKGKDLEKIVNVITSNEEVWIQTMMLEELGITPEEKNPKISASITFISFLICGFLPLLIFVLIGFFPSLQANAFMYSCIITGVTIFIVGSLRSIVIAKNWIVSGIEMLLVGGAAATVAYYIGYFLKGLA
ncbi:MAG: VIT1/CCC1 transporter family protein [Candidatus Gracilibacteria bacterium]|nr:VIT1/CCC1 transporter family protein [Candidatus Gracilibacteria bacterium]